MSETEKFNGKDAEDVDINTYDGERRDRKESTTTQCDSYNKVTKAVRFPFDLVDEEAEMQNQRSLAAVLCKILQDSSVYAVSKLGSSTNWLRRITWAVVLILGIGGCSYEVSRFVALYFQYPVIISLQVENDWKTEFPAVTVCNLNRIKASAISNWTVCGSFGLNFLECFELQGEDEYPVDFIDSTERMKFATCSGHQSGRYSAFHRKMQKFLNAYNKIDAKTRRDIGHQAKYFIKSCSFNGELCNERNFTEFQSSQYGNCFTFNGRLKNDSSNLMTQYVGPNSGLELELDLERSDYSSLTPEVGARVVVHHPTSEPNPETLGVDITPGLQTSISMKKTSVRRLPYPYKDRCRVYDENVDDSFESQKDCIRRCVQNINILRCECADPSLPTPPNVTHCELSNETQVCCLDDLLKNISDYGLSCNCPLPCVEIDYEMTLSTSIWPSDRHFSVYIFHWKPNEDEVEVSRVDQFRRNFAKLKIFYQTLEHKYYNQEPMFQDSELFSHFGGQMGLWLGLSIVAIFECVEGLLVLFHFLVSGQMAKKSLKKMTSP